MEPDKNCATCGRRITWRKKWERHWDEIRYCSDRCRRHKPSAVDRALEQTIIGLLAERAAGSSICPSEAARAHFGKDAWRDEMERTRQAARRMVAAARVEIIQGGAVVDPSTAKGPIRLRRGRRFG